VPEVEMRISEHKTVNMQMNIQAGHGKVKYSLSDLILEKHIV